MKDNNLHDNDVHLGASFDVGFASGRAESFIDRTPRGAGPDARCAMLVGAVSLVALTALARSISLARSLPKTLRELRVSLTDDVALRSLVTTMAARAKATVDAEIEAILGDSTLRPDAARPDANA